MPTIQDAMSELLSALGFLQMAEDIKTEHDIDRLRKYARIIVKNSPEPHKLAIANRFRLHRPALF